MDNKNNYILKLKCQFDERVPVTLVMTGTVTLG